MTSTSYRSAGSILGSYVHWLSLSDQRVPLSDGLHVLMSMHPARPPNELINESPLPPQ